MKDLKNLLALSVLCAGSVVGCDVEESTGDGGMGGSAETDATVGGAGGAGGSAGGGGGEGGAAPPANVKVRGTWSATGLTVEIEDAVADGSYYLGLAETGNGPDGWYGEDCLKGVKNDLDACHPVPAGNTGITLNKVAAPGDVMAGSTTLLSEALSVGVTYVLIRGAAGDEGWHEGTVEECYTWGRESDYYGGLGCNPVEMIVDEVAPDAGM